MSGFSLESREPTDPRTEPFRPPYNPEPQIEDISKLPFRPPDPDRLPDQGYEKTLEGLDTGEKTTDAREFVGMTEIRDFERSGLISNEDIARHVRDTLPSSHSEEITSIAYRPDHLLFVTNPGVLGFYRSGEITIGPIERSQWPEGLDVLQTPLDEGVLWTITHEVGHDVYQHYLEASPALSGDWYTLHNYSFALNASAGRGFVTAYSATDVQEDFCESYMAYVHDPERLQFYNPEKYEFMRDYVFSGREYPVRSDLTELQTLWHDQSVDQAIGDEGVMEDIETWKAADQAVGVGVGEKTLPVECPWPGYEHEFEMGYQMYRLLHSPPYADAEIEQMVNSSSSVGQVRGHYENLMSCFNQADQSAQYIRDTILATAGNASPRDRAGWDGQLVALSETMAISHRQLEIIQAKFPQLPPPKPYFPPMIG